MKESLLAKIVRWIKGLTLKPKSEFHCYCLGIDVVGYSKRTTDIQRLMVQEIQGQIVSSRALRDTARNSLVFLPTGDGVIICLLESRRASILIDLARELQHRLKEGNESKSEDERIVVRMGIHSGTGSSYIDINGNLNVAGTVVNNTQRITSFGGDWHVVASSNAWNDIATLDNSVQKLFHKAGTREAKHGQTFEIYNIYEDGSEPFGNAELPAPKPDFDFQESMSRPLRSPREAEMRSTGVLEKCVAMILGASSLKCALDDIKRMQAAWNLDVQQVSVVVRDVVRLHRQSNIEHARADGYWCDHQHRSVYPEIKRVGEGVRNLRIDCNLKRMTVLAFRWIQILDGVVIAEAHFFPDRGQPEANTTLNNDQ